ncbi:RICIN domain-containing protein [Actinomycetes bacterium KLBMP 9759]
MTRLERHAGRGLLVLAGVFAMLVGPTVGSASAATTFFALNDRSAKLEMAASGGRVLFVKEFIQPPPSCASCAETGTPENQQWARGRTDEAAFVTLVSRPTGQCVDIPAAPVRVAGAAVAQLAGTALVLAPCDNSDTQKWKTFSATGGSTTFQNKWSGLVLTNVGATAQLQPFNKRLGGPDFFGVQALNTQRTEVI